MKIVTLSLRSTSPYSQSQAIMADKLPKESPRDYEERCWRGRIHSDEDGNVFIPNTAFKNAIAECAKYLSMQIPGKGKATYTKHFEAGVTVVAPVPLGIKVDDVRGDWRFVPSDGKRGGGKRVWKCFPLIPKWEAEVTYHVMDDTITEEVFEQHAHEMGRFIGIGRFRPRNNGFYGRFNVEGFKWA